MSGVLTQPKPGQVTATGLSDIQLQLAAKQKELQTLSEQAAAKQAEAERIKTEQAKTAEEYKRLTLPQHAQARQFQPLQRATAERAGVQAEQAKAIQEQLFGLGTAQTKAAGEYSTLTEQYNIEAQKAIAALPQTPTMADVPKAQALYNKGIISSADFSGYKKVAQRNEAIVQRQAVVQPTILAVPVKTTSAVAPKAGRMIGIPELIAPVQKQVQEKIQPVKTVPIAEHDISSSRLITVFDSSGKAIGTVRGGTLYTLDAPGKQDIYFKTPKEAQQYAENIGLSGRQVGVSYTPEGRVITSAEYWSQKEAREAAAKAGFGGTFSAEALKQITAPIGAALPGSQLEKKVKMLSTGTAQFVDEAAFKKATEQVQNLISFEAKGAIVDTSKFKSGAEQQKAVDILKKVGEKQELTSAERQFGLSKGIITEAAPKPGEWGYHATAAEPGGILGANIKATEAKIQESIYKIAFAPPSEGIQQAMSEKYWQSLSPAEKASLLVVGSFNKPVEIGGGFIESKLFGGDKQYQKDVYDYLIKGAKIVDVPIIGRQIVPKKGVVEETAVGIGTLAATGVAFRGVSYVVGGGLKIGEAGAGLVAKETGLLGEKVFTGVAAKTTAQTVSTLAELSAKAFGGAAARAELITGIGAATPFVADIAASKTKGEAIAKVGFVAATLPLMGMGYELSGKAGTTLGEALPSSREILRFTAAKAEPIFETKTAQFLKEKTPESTRALVKESIIPVIEKITRQPAPYELMTPALREIYDASSPKRQIKIEAAVRLMDALKDAPPEIKQRIDFSGYDSPKYGGKIGAELKKMIQERPGEFVIGGSTSVGAFVPKFRRGADWDIYAKQYIKTAEKVADISAQKYPGSYVKTKKDFINTIAQKTGESIIDVHKMSEITGEIGQPITTTIGGRTVQLTKGKVREPVKVEGLLYGLHPKKWTGS